MQSSRFLYASICSAALLCAVPAYAFGGGGHAGSFSGSGHVSSYSTGRVSGAHMSFAAGNARGGNFGGGGGHPGNWHGGHGGGWGYPGYGYGYGAPYIYSYDYPDDETYAYDTPDYDYSYADNGYDDNGYGPGVYAQGDDQGAGPYTPSQEASTQFGNYCRTPVKVCQLYQAANVGADCSCRDGAGRAYGQVSP